MKKQLIPVLVALTLLPTASFAERYVESYSDRQNDPGAYFSGFIGTSITRDTNISTTEYSGTVRTYDEELSFDPSLNLGIAGGYDFGPARMEAELSYKHADIDGIKDLNGGSTYYRNPDGSLGAFSFMCNLFFDIPTNSPITPYVGGGVGFSTVYISDTDAILISGSTAEKTRLYDESDDTVFAYQVGAGVEIALNKKLSFDLAYRYFGTDTATFDSGETTSDAVKFRSHNATIGLRVKF